MLLSVKACRVYFRDRVGVEHGVRVNAVNRYHAFGLALHGMRRCSWCHPDYHEVRELIVQMLDGDDRGSRLRVTREQFDLWLGEPPPKPGDKLREYLFMLLGKMEPDRDFKNGMKSR